MKKVRGGVLIRKVVLKCLCVSVPLCLCASNSHALELSLEENKGESGTVGYVDIDRVFKEYSGTTDAREEFLDEVKKKEESVNQRKRGVYALKADIAKLRQERAFALTLPSLLATEERLNRAGTEVMAAAAAVGTSSAAAEGVSVSSGAVAVSSDTVMSLPGMAPPSRPAAQDAPAPAEDPAGTPSTAGGEPASAPEPEKARPAEPPAASGVPADYFKFSISTSVADIDSAITAKEDELARKEAELKTYQRQVERELLEYESHRSEILLGRIYIALKELALRTGVSVVVDKRNILFGHSAVDLTGDLLAALEERR